MHLSFMQANASRKALFALAMFALLAGATGAEARAGAGVVVASSSPSYAAGRVIEAGEAVRLEAGATVTVLEESGRLSTIAASGAYQPSAPSQAPRASARQGGESVIDSLALLLRGDRQVRTPGGVRTLGDTDEDGCARGAADYAALQAALQRGCAGAASDILAKWVERDAPAQLFVQPAAGAGGAAQLLVQTNFEAFLYCRVRNEAGMAALTPEPGALPMRLLASQSRVLTLPPAPETGGAVQCMAVGAGSGDAPDVGDWPQQFDTQRLEQSGAAVATVTLLR
jgi:hypothetical protein